MFIYDLLYITYMKISTAMWRGGFFVVESSGVAYDDRWLTLAMITAGLVSWSSYVDTDDSHSNTDSSGTVNGILHSTVIRITQVSQVTVGI